MSTIFAHICTVKKRFSYKLFERVQYRQILVISKKQVLKTSFSCGIWSSLHKTWPGKDGESVFFCKKYTFKTHLLFGLFYFWTTKTIFNLLPKAQNLGVILKLTKTIFCLRREIFAMHFVVESSEKKMPRYPKTWFHCKKIVLQFRGKHS